MSSFNFDATGSLSTSETDGGDAIDPNSFYPNSINSGEAWGTASIIGTLSASSIQSEETWGTPWFAPVVIYAPVSSI